VIARPCKIRIRESYSTVWTIAQDVPRRRLAIDAEEEPRLRIHVRVPPAIENDPRDASARGPSDGADLVAVFEPGAGTPLVVGSNTLKTFVTGLPSTIGVNIYPSPVDTDTIIFTVASVP
jgi:hypothetical protein